MTYPHVKVRIPRPSPGCPACAVGILRVRMIKNSTIKKEVGDILVYPDGPYWVAKCEELPSGAYDVYLKELTRDERVVYEIMES